MEDDKLSSQVFCGTSGKEDRSFINGSFNKYNISHRSYNDEKDVWDSKDVQSYFKDEDEYCSDHSLDKYNSVTFENFDAIPEEFRPNGKGIDLLKVQTLPKEEVLSSVSKTKENSGLPFKTQPSEMERNMKDDYRNRWPVSNKRSYNNSNFGEGKPENQDTQQKPEFFFTSEKSKNREKFGRKYFHNYESQTVSHFDKDRISFKKVVKSERRKNFGGTENTSPKYAPGVTAEKLDNTAKITNQPKSEENNRQKITKKVTIEKYINWKDDLCKFEVPNRKPSFSCKLTTKITSDEYLPSDNSYEVTEEKQMSHEFKKKQCFYSNEEKCNSKFNTDSVKDPNKSWKDNRSKGMQSRNFMEGNRGRVSNAGNNFQRKHFTLHNVNPSIRVIQHEVRVIHVNAPSTVRKPYPYTHRNHNQKGFERKNYQHRNMNGHTNKYLQNSNITGNAINSESNTNLHTSNYSELNEKSKCGEYKKKQSTTTNEVIEKIENLFLKEKIQSSSISAPDTAYKLAIMTSEYDGKNEADLLIQNGKEISDIIVGSYVALNTLLAIYDKWWQHRLRTMTLFEELEKNLSQSCNKNKTVKDIAAMINASTNVLHFVPDQRVAVAGKVVAALSDIVSKLFSSSPRMKNYVLNDFELRKCLQEDIDSTTEIYMLCMQCSHQFQEACKLIEEFHCSLQNGCLKEYVEIFDIGFLKEISELNPKIPQVYYKRLEKCYEKLNKNQVTDVDKAFCRAFEDWPEAMTVISSLPNRFNKESCDSSDVATTWEKIYELFLNEDSLVSDVLKKVQDCILILIKERNVMEKYALDLKKRL